MIALTLAVGVYAFLTAGPGFRRDEVECEEAALKIGECCDGLSVSQVNCDYSDGCGDPVYPDISPAESLCIRDAACSDLERNGVCERLAGIVRGNADGTHDPSEVPYLGACQ
jgi:hypothetical protein